MSTAIATDAPAPAKSKKKLIIIVAATVLVLLLAAGAAMWLLKKPAVDPDAEGSEAPAKAAVKHDPKSVPTFVPLEPFTVNLADRDAERFAQIGITLEVDDAKTAERMKNFMPVIRSHILMAIADRSAADLLAREGKARLAVTVMRETSRALGVDVAAEAAPADNDSGDDSEEVDKKPKKKKNKAGPALPVKAVHFSNFIVQ